MDKSNECCCSLERYEPTIEELKEENHKLLRENIEMRTTITCLTRLLTETTKSSQDLQKLYLEYHSKYWKLILGDKEQNKNIVKVNGKKLKPKKAKDLLDKQIGEQKNDK